MGTTAKNGSSTLEEQALAAKTTTIVEYVDWETLPPRARAIARKLGPMLSDGYTIAEIGKHFGKSEDWASTRVQELRTAILQQVRDRLETAEREIGMMGG